MTKLIIPVKFRETVEKFPNKDCIGSKKSKDSPYTYKSFQEVLSEVNSFASGLINLGIKKDTKVAIISESRPEWVISDQAIIALGAINVPIYPTLSSAQLAYVIEDSESEVLIVSKEIHYRKLKSIRKQIPNLKHVINIEDVKLNDNYDTRSFSEILSNGEDSINENLPKIDQSISQINENDICSIIYTSGTTSEPKGVMLSHKNFISNAISSTKCTEIDENILHLSFLPLSHVFERVIYYSLLTVTGGTIAYAERIETFMRNIKEVKPNILIAVPRIYEKIYSKVLNKISKAKRYEKIIFKYSLSIGYKYFEQKLNNLNPSLFLKLKYHLANKLVLNNIKSELGGNLDILISGSAPLSADIGIFFASLGLIIQEGYGLTESSPIISVNRRNNVEFGSVGQPIPGVEVMIADDGEILAKGPNIMKGYYGDDIATKMAIDDNGWLHTGDIGELDSENRLKITDRKKDIIVMSNGKNVAPQLIESLLISSKYIEQIAIIGDKQKFISALIVPSYENVLVKAKKLGIEIEKKKDLYQNEVILSFFKSEIEKKSKDRLAQFEKIKKFSLLNNEFSQRYDELTPSLKLKRKVITKNYAKQIEVMYGSKIVKSK